VSKTGYYLIDHDTSKVRKFYTSRKKSIQVIVLHTAENLPDTDGIDSGAENVSRYGASTDRQVSWHVTVDSDSTIRNLPDGYTAFHVQGYNGISLGLEIATQAHRWKSTKDRTSWERKVLARTAEVVKDWAEEHSIPLKRLSKSEVDRGIRGIVSHSALDSSRRSDPGVGFPWDELFELLEQPDPKPEPGKKATKKSTKKSTAKKAAKKTTSSSKSKSWEEELLVELGTLKLGSRGNAVARVQHLLGLFRIYVKSDGIFGLVTERAVSEFQHSQRIGIDGVVGRRTWEHLLVKGRF
jgi:N-acetyl-anhydromuramyl-L-alanine amidase AmpD